MSTAPNAKVAGATYSSAGAIAAATQSADYSSISSSAPLSAPAPLAFTIREFCSIAKVGHTKAYEDARAGRLRIVKNGKRSIVTAEEARRYIEALPALELPKGDAEPHTKYTPETAVRARRLNAAARRAAEDAAPPESPAPVRRSA